MSAVQRETGDAGSATQLEADPNLLIDRNGEDVLSTLKPLGGERRGQPAALSIASSGSPRGSLRIGGVPSASSRSSPASEETVAANLAKLAGEVEQLRTHSSERTAVDPQSDPRVRKDVATIKDSIEQLEAFVSIALVAKMDQMISDKLTIVHRVEASRRRLSRWLAVFVVLTIALAVAMIMEVRTGQVAPTLEAYASAATAAMADTGLLVTQGAVTAIKLARGFVSDLRT